MDTTHVPADRTVTVTVPATSANLGPGFDTLGLALGLYDELTVTARAEPGVSVTVEGVGIDDIACDESNLVVSTIRHTLDACGIEQCGLEVHARNTIPHGRGLGSSGAAIVSGVLAASGLLEGIAAPEPQTLLRLATELEGHPDNVAPALFGGLAIAWMTPEGPQHKKLIVHRGVSPLVLVPEFTMSTELARSLQPETVPHEDAVFNVSRSALLVAALTQSPELLMPATEDRLHQGYRAEAMPETDELITLLRSRGHAAVVSGSGPSVLVLCSDPGQRLEAVRLVTENAQSHWQSHMLAVDFRGASLVSRRRSLT